MPLVSAHAIRRYRERVDPSASIPAALTTIADIAANGRRRPRPRRWTKVVGCRAGAVYVYSQEHPAVCLVMRRQTVVTVFSRIVCGQWRRVAA
jgi:hypothetical protein